MWLSGMSKPDLNTINRFRSDRLQDLLKQVFSQVILLLGNVEIETGLIFKNLSAQLPQQRSAQPLNSHPAGGALNLLNSEALNFLNSEALNFLNSEALNFPLTAEIHQ